MNTQTIYNLSAIPGFSSIINDVKGQTQELIEEQQEKIDQEQKFYSVKQYSTKSNEKYTILRYNKDLLCQDIVNTYGLLRSVILSGTNVVSFAPPKSLCGETFMVRHPVKTEYIYAEEFIEGTMINVFFDRNYGANGCWQIATRNTVGAEVAFYKWSTKTFNQMFLEACISNNFSIQTLNPKFCYSFVLQHPENRIVIPFKTAQIYLVGVYEIRQTENDCSVLVASEDLSIVKTYGLWHFTGIRFPERYEFTSYTELIEKFASANTPYNVMGIVVKNSLTGERTKFRNPIYEEVRHLRGNQPKLQYQYLCLRHSGKLSEFLKYYPETKEEMSKFRDQVHMFTRNLHKNYISCYVKKEQELRLFPSQYRTHMYKLHEHFINDLRPNKLCLTNTEVIKYVNALHPSLLMYCLNYNMRKRLVDSIQAP